MSTADDERQVFESHLPDQVVRGLRAYGLDPEEAMTVLVIALWKICEASEVPTEEACADIARVYRSIERLPERLQ